MLDATYPPESDQSLIVAMDIQKGRDNEAVADCGTAVIDA